MTVKSAKVIIEKEIENFIKGTDLKFVKKDFKLSFINENFSIDYFVFVEDYFGKRIEVFSECQIKLNVLLNFYKKHNVPYPEWAQVSIGDNTLEILKLFTKDSEEIHSLKFSVEKNNSFEINVTDLIGVLMKKILFVHEKIKFELSYKLSKEFDLNSNTFLKFNNFDTLVLFHFFKPEKLHSALMERKLHFFDNGFHKASYERYIILLERLCKLNNLDLENYIPKLNFLQKLKYRFG